MSDTYFWRDFLSQKDAQPGQSAEQALVIYFQNYIKEIQQQLTKMSVGQTLFCPFDLSDEYEEGVFFSRIEENTFTVRAGLIPSFTYSRNTVAMITPPEMDVRWRHVPQPVPRQRLLKELDHSIQQVRLISEQDVAWLIAFLENSKG